MRSNCVPIASNTTLLIGLRLLLFKEMHNNLHFHQILRHNKPVVPKFKSRQKLLT